VPALDIPAEPAIVDLDIAAFAPAEVLQAPAECRDPALALWIVLRYVDQHADPPHPLGLLRARGE